MTSTTTATASVTASASPLDAIASSPGAAAGVAVGSTAVFSLLCALAAVIIAARRRAARKKAAASVLTAATPPAFVRDEERATPSPVRVVSSSSPLARAVSSFEPDARAALPAGWSVVEITTGGRAVYRRPDGSVTLDLVPPPRTPTRLGPPSHGLH